MTLCSSVRVINVDLPSRRDIVRYLRNHSSRLDQGDRGVSEVGKNPYTGHLLYRAMVSTIPVEGLTNTRALAASVLIL